jgi:hypothetical protein
MTPEEINRKILEILHEEYREDPRHMVESSTLFTRIQVEDDEQFFECLNSLMEKGFIKCIRKRATLIPLICNAKITKKGIDFIDPKK